MKKHIVLISSILQFIAVVTFFGTIRAFVTTETTNEIRISLLLITVIAQFLSIKLKEKYPTEVASAENIMQKPKNSYGWLALGVFGIAALIVVLYVMFSK